MTREATKEHPLKTERPRIKRREERAKEMMILGHKKKILPSDGNPNKK